MTIMKDDVESIRTMQDAARAAQKRIAALDKADDTSGDPGGGEQPSGCRCD